MSASPSPRRLVANSLAVLLLVLRLAVPGSMLPVGNNAQQASPAGLLGDVPICHADGDQGSVPSHSDGKPTTPMHDCALCPMCQLAAAPALLAAAAWIPILLQAGTARLVMRPQSTGPPLPERYAAAPRGPPASAV